MGAACLAGVLVAAALGAPRPSEGQRGEGVPRGAAGWHDPVSEVGQRARGLYLGAAYAREHGAEALVREVRSARMNAVVLDLKDAEGRVHHDSRIPELAGSRTGWLSDAAATVRTLHDHDVYAIARISCFADRRLPERVPARAIRDVRPNRDLWVSWGTGGTWLDPYHPDNHRLVVALAREAEALGFDEIQLDYVRFPVDDGTQYARYPAERDAPRAEVLLRLLREVDEAVDVPIGVDVFGLAAYRRGDPSGLGQDLEAWTRHVEVFSPMLYVNSMTAWRRGEDDRTFQLVFGGAWRLRQRVGPRPVIRPFLQAFEQGADRFDERFIFEQVRAARRARADGFLFWHPGHVYGVVRRAMRGDVRGLLPFPIPRRTLRRRAR
ncbi:MAG TPA: putative glycoside hydrolase [Sandaracinaceae bacterium LLY-WYZ-13_1]|nr:putative glycoside hydrolase [Sandaracinaceae bacterium LLY-WYZ-13_1]